MYQTPYEICMDVYSFFFFFIIMEVQGERSSPPRSYWAALIPIEGDVPRNLQRSRGGGDQDEHYKLLGGVQNLALCLAEYYFTFHMVMPFKKKINRKK